MSFLSLIFVPHFDYNSAVVVSGVVVYSIGCVLIGNFMILQKRSLLADVLSHAALPGIVIIFIVMILVGANSISKSLLILLLGAFISTIFAIFVMKLFLQYTTIKSDAIQASILGLFFGIGVAVLGLAQRLPTGSTAGMFTYIYGNTASMQLQDAYLFMLSSLLILCIIIFKKRQITIFCFDHEYAYSLGIKRARLDIMLLLLIIIQVIIGIQAIGLLMVSSMFIIPVVTAKFWTQCLNVLIILSIIVSVLCGYIGAMVSANSTNFPTGAVIVTVLEIFFIFSLFFGKEKGILIKLWDRRAFFLKVNVEHILRIIYEMLEENPDKNLSTEDYRIYSTPSIDKNDLQSNLHITPFLFHSRLKYMQKKNYIIILGDSLQLTSKGVFEAKRVLRNHRLWETYLLYYTDASPEDVDFTADKVEHVLGYDFTLELEKISSSFHKGGTDATIIPSPHSMQYKQKSAHKGQEKED